MNLPLSSDNPASVAKDAILSTSASAAASGSPVPAAAAAKSWFRDVVDALLLIALLHLVNVGFRWWNARKLRKKDDKSNNISSAASHTTRTSTVSETSSLMKGGKFSGQFASKFTNKLKAKKNARFQLSSGFSRKEDSDITSTFRTSNVAANKATLNEEDDSEHTPNEQMYFPPRYPSSNPPTPRSQQEQNRRSTMGRTWTIPQGAGLRPIVLNFATCTLEECLDQVDMLEDTVSDEFELVDILVKCCSQERVYFENYGAVASFLCQNSMKTTPRHSNVAPGGATISLKNYKSPARPSRLNNNRSVWRQALERKFASCYRKDTKKLRKLRNVAMFFSHLLTTNSISYQVFDIVKLCEQHTTTASRYFLKILLKDLAHHLTLERLQRRIQEFPHAFAGLCLMQPNQKSSSSNASLGSSKHTRRASVTSTTSTLTSYTTNSVLHNVRNMKFAVHYLTEIGLKPLTKDMRDHLTRLEREQREHSKRQRKNNLLNQSSHKTRTLVEVLDSSRHAVQPDAVEISNHSVVTDEASSAASSINSTSIQSDHDRQLNVSSQQSVVSQLSTSTRTRSASFRKTAMNSPHLKNSFGSLGPDPSHADLSFHSRESVGAFSRDASVGGVSSSSAKKVVRSSHRKLSRRIVPHAPHLMSQRNHTLGALQTPQPMKRNLFGANGGTTPASTKRLIKSHSPKPNRPQPPRQLPFSPNLDQSDKLKADDSSSSSDSEILPKARTGAVGVDEDDDNHISEHDYNDVEKKEQDDDDDDSYGEELKEDMEDDVYDVYYGDHKIGKKKPGSTSGGMVGAPNEDTDGGRLDSFHLPSSDDELDHHRRRHQQQLDNNLQDDFQVTGRRNVAFRKRPSIINEEMDQ